MTKASEDQAHKAPRVDEAGEMLVDGKEEKSEST